MSQFHSARAQPRHRAPTGVLAASACDDSLSTSCIRLSRRHCCREELQLRVNRTPPMELKEKMLGVSLADASKDLLRAVVCCEREMT